MKLAATFCLILVFQMLTAQVKAQSEPKPELIVQTGHTAGINSVAFSPDGKTIASGGSDETIKLWSVETGLELRTLTGNSKKEVSVGWVNSVEFSPDGAMLATAGEDNAIKLWNVDSGQVMKMLAAHTDSVRSIAFSPNGKFLISGSDDGTTKLWNIETGREIKTFTGLPNDKVASVAFSPDGILIAATIGNREEKINLWSAETGQLMRTIDLKFAIVNSIAFSPDGKTIAAGGENNFITLWNIESGQETTRIKKSGNINNDIISIAFSPDGKMLALGYGKTISFGNNNDTVKLFDAENGQELKPLAGQLNILRSLTFSPDGRIIAAGSNKTVTLWNAETGQEIKKLSGYTDKDK